MRTLAMFPLGSVLFPAMPLPLRVFEPRYLVMLQELLAAGTPEFGVVLIERGFEVGGGEHRFDVGTVADIAQIAADEGFVKLVAQGRGRFRVHEWLADDPYPKAIVEDLPDWDWTPMADEVTATEQTVRRTLAMASEFSEGVWPAAVELADETADRAWQLAAITPVGPLDQHKLLGAGSPADLLAAVSAACADAEEGFRLTGGEETWEDD